MSEQQTLIDSIENCSGRSVRIHLQTFKGKPYVDIRTWVQGDDDAWKATPKGLCLHVEILPALIQALQRADKALEGEGKG